MAQDLRNLFKDAPNAKAIKMSDGHEARFFEKLEAHLPKKTITKRRFNYLNIAASIVILIGLGYAYVQVSKPSIEIAPPTVTSTNGIDKDLKTFGEFSPDLKKVEDYYLASINLELSKIQLTSDNKELVDGYMERLKELNDEYDRLTVELNKNGLNEASLDALIDNLKFRLNLLMRLKEKLEEYNNNTFVPEHA